MKADKITSSRPPFEFIEMPADFPDFNGVSYDSRMVIPGELFIAVKGFSTDGHDYVLDAEKKGAIAIVCETKNSQVKIPQIIVSDSRRALSFFSALFYGFPSENMNIIGVTGTNGKTTTCSIIAEILSKHGRKTGIIGTIKVAYPLKNNTWYEKESSNTTPESADLQKIINEMRNNNVTDIVMEVSSHAIALGRVDDISFNTLVYTNLTQDHLDFHKTMEEYAKVKSDFIKNKAADKNPPFISINIDDPVGLSIRDFLKKSNFKKIIDYSTENDASLKASDLKTGLEGSSGIIGFNNQSHFFQSPLSGRHNIQNILGALGACTASGISIDECVKLLKDLMPVRGRLEQVRNDKRPYIFIDYAHTPDALENVLKSLRPLCENRLICVFGCGGDRDRKKRPLMAEVSAKNADISIITSDNPRTENEEAIILDIENGLKTIIPDKNFEAISDNEKNFYFIEKNRKKAIEKALLISNPKDCILIAGKGHETYQIIGTKKYHFDDREAVLENIREIYGN
ncbi:MAG: UDP-N-acetylmuramoyl-L-alanyl-D-glutamate--2,6-diaminopimelate ligase [Desulfobacteraceae bacterium]|nr:UDP-N-acetylmuramoyl-L-alanyl-D-glutamate--2,6-diaminopimelate ligase [Desulfobacteraceae bacterium]